VLVFAYDGTLNGDWVAHYAVRFAANDPTHALRLLHVSGAPRDARLEERIERIAREARVLGVALEVEVTPRRGTGVADRILELVPEQATVIAGTRARPRNRTLLAGTVSARLIESARFSVVAMRVVHPGVLGQPGRVLLPVAGRPRQAALALPFLRLLGQDLRRLDLLMVRELSPLRMRLMSTQGLEKRLTEGRAWVAQLEDELRRDLASHPFEVDAGVVVSSDAPREILHYARSCRSRLIALGASRRTLLQRLASGAPIERILREAHSDVAVYRSLE
jgi:nucleotide-binding universal stress UspA family protein